MRSVVPALIATGAWGWSPALATVPHRSGRRTGARDERIRVCGQRAARLAAADGGRAPVWLILLTATIVNMRFVIFSAGLHPYFRHLSLTRRLILGYLTSDLGYLLGDPTLGRRRASGAGRHPPGLVLSRTGRGQLAHLAVDVGGRHPAGGPDPDPLGDGLQSACWH